MTPDPYHTHEALDRCHLASLVLQDHLLDHPFFAANPELRTKVQRAVGLLEEVYQEIGEQHAEALTFEEEDETQAILADPELYPRLLKSIAQAREGKTRNAEEVRERLGLHPRLTLSQLPAGVDEEALLALNGLDEKTLEGKGDEDLADRSEFRLNAARREALPPYDWGGLDPMTSGKPIFRTSDGLFVHEPLDGPDGNDFELPKPIEPNPRDPTGERDHGLD